MLGPRSRNSLEMVVDDLVISDNYMPLAMDMGHHRSIQLVLEHSNIICKSEKLKLKLKGRSWQVTCHGGCGVRFGHLPDDGDQTCGYSAHKHF